MKREELIRLARNCGSAYVNRHYPGVTSFGFTEDCLARFVELIEIAEREECAKICDDMRDKLQWGEMIPINFPENCADAIRARSNAKVKGAE